jgi:hypothetical protein
LQEKAAEAKAALDSSEARVPEASQRLETLDQQYDAIAGQDNNSAFTKAIELMAENDSRDDVRTLYREAARTKTDADRVIVEKIDRLTQSIARADEEIADTGTNPRGRGKACRNRTGTTGIPPARL